MITAFEEKVASFVAANVGFEAAERHVRKNFPALAADYDAHRERQTNVLEKAEQLAVIKYLRERGFTVRSTSQARASKIAIGFADLLVTHKRLPIAFFFETKRQKGGVISEAQQEFGDDCRRCGIAWYAGDRYEAARICRELGVSEAT